MASLQRDRTAVPFVVVTGQGDEKIAVEVMKQGALDYVMKDTGLRCLISPQSLKTFLTPERQTRRGSGNWGVRVLKHHEDELAFEPGRGGGKWQFFPVTWLSPADGD